MSGGARHDQRAAVVCHVAQGRYHLRGFAQGAIPDAAGIDALGVVVNEEYRHGERDITRMQIIGDPA
ncbi:hypothetical protein GCM10022255_013800 [Dactylosporangium darangshiense]|uniref:Uncharacterized protein n=1 Tax=Dactylosporangium darangshiense TaxID=579108 RepID=A0ABP8D0F7_9ACTN